MQCQPAVHSTLWETKLHLLDTVVVFLFFPALRVFPISEKCQHSWIVLCSILQNTCYRMKSSTPSVQIQRGIFSVPLPRSGITQQMQRNIVSIPSESEKKEYIMTIYRWVKSEWGDIYHNSIQFPIYYLSVSEYYK